MFTEQLPLRVDPYKMAKAASEYQTSLALADLTRAAELLAHTQGVLTLRLSFAIDPQGIRTISGHIQGEVEVLCQRCLQPMLWTLDSEFTWGLVHQDADAANLPRAYEPVVLEGEELELLPVLEDEVILSLPQAPYHKAGDCKLDLSQVHVEETASEAAPSKENPFSVLKKLKQKH